MRNSIGKNGAGEASRSSARHWRGVSGYASSSSSSARVSASAKPVATSRCSHWISEAAVGSQFTIHGRNAFGWNMRRIALGAPSVATLAASRKTACTRALPSLTFSTFQWRSRTSAG